jgi:hypothetical protein
MLAAGCAFRVGPKVTRRQGSPSPCHAAREVRGPHPGPAGPASARAASAAICPSRDGRPRSVRPRRCRPFVRPRAGIDRIQDSHLSLLDRPPGIAQRIDGVFPGALSVIFCHLGVQLVVFAAHAAVQGLHLRRGIGLHRLPLAMPAAAQGAAAAGSGRKAEGSTYPRGTQSPGDHGHVSGTALHAAAQAGRSSLVPWPNLSGLQPLICSADAVARRLGRRPRCSRPEHGRLLPGRPSPLR